MGNIADTFLNKWFNQRLLIIIGAIIVPLIVMSILDINDVDPLIIFLVLSVGFIAGIWFLKITTRSAIIPFIPLPVIYVWIFLDKKLTDAIGISPKPHIMVFGLALLMAVYYMVMHFKYLWSKFPIFRLLFIFFIINIPYFLFYHSDFRNSTCVDYALFSKKDVHALVGVGNQSYTRQFGHDETQFLIYLTSLCPLVSVTVSLMVLYGVNNIKNINEKIIEIIKYFLFIFAGFALAAIVTMGMGITQFVFLEGRLVSDLYGTTSQTGSFEMFIFLILFIGLKYYLNELEFHPDKDILNLVMDGFIMGFFLLNVFSLRKTAFIAIVASIATMVFINSVLGFKADFIRFDRQDKRLKGIIFLFFLALAMVLLAKPDLIINTCNSLNDIFDKLGARFSTSNTLDERKVLWDILFKDWISKLTFFKILFGFGLDTSREAGFFSSISMGQELAYAHNVYIEMFYDYGLVALIYFGAIISVLISNIKSIISAKAGKYVKLFSSISLSLIVCYFTYYLAESPLMPYNIIFFSLIGFLESVKLAYSRAK